MDSFDLSSEFVVSGSGSRLLSESSLLPENSNTGQSVDDLSLADLSLTDRPQPRNLHRRPFSLLAQPRFEDRTRDESQSAIAEEDEGDAIEEQDDLDQTMTAEEAEKARRAAAKTREEKLESDLFILRKLNSAFGIYQEALKETKSSTEVSQAFPDDLHP